MSDAQKFFDENLQFLGPTDQARSAKDPEKYNLYTGLAVMAGQLSEIQSQTADLQARIRRIEQSLPR